MNCETPLKTITVIISILALALIRFADTPYSFNKFQWKGLSITEVVLVSIWFYP